MNRVRINFDSWLKIDQNREILFSEMLSDFAENARSWK